MKKVLSLFCIHFLFLFSSVFYVFSEESSPWDIYVQTDFSYSPGSEIKPGKTHFSFPNEVFYSVLFRSTLKADYRINTPLGETFLTKDANIVLESLFEVSPVSIKPGFLVTFTPLPFLSFYAGTQIGTAWSFIEKNGMEKYVLSEESYKALDPFSSWYSKSLLGAKFQFDTGAVWKGDWTHVVALAQYTLAYTKLTGVPDGTPWSWQTTEHYINGLNYEWYFVLGYQMPLKLSLAGFCCDLYGYYESAPIDSIYSDFNAYFMTCETGPFVFIKINEHNSLTVQLTFMNRRSFTKKEGADDPNRHPLLVSQGTEFYFDSLGFRWTYTF
ncbi:MAG: hypothetical protein J6Z17_05740 [Treponema sp.]|nr:hypothetical protein [Treponema sp.]